MLNNIRNSFGGRGETCIFAVVYNNLNLLYMKKNLTFVAIDMETLNESRTSVCEIGMVKYVDGNPVDALWKKIRPSGEIKKANWQKKHLKHIDEEELLHAPSFAEVYKEMCDFIGDSILVCHQAGADMNYLYYLEKEAGVKGLCDLHYADTMEMCEHFLGKKKLSECFSILFEEDREEQHSAIWDAHGCAKVFNELWQRFDCEPFIHTQPYLPEKERPKKGIKTECVPADGMEIEDPLLMFYDFRGKTVVISGEEDSRREQVKERLESWGAAVTSSISGKTDALIVGSKGVGPTKRVQAIEQKTARPDTFHIFTVDSIMSVIDGKVKEDSTRPVPTGKHIPTHKS